jgi:4-hydroxy-tetrahydrodipicolinate reductase
MTKIALVGYGKMGRMIHALAPECGCEVVATFDATPDALPPCDAVIEFSTPETALSNIRRFAELKVNAVIGTTGWLEHLPEARAAVEAAGTGLIYGANFSVGVALFSKIVEEASRLLAGERDYEAWAWEMHHSAKKDAPSGTLLKLLGDMKRGGYQAHVDVSSSRAGKVPGTHEIGFDSAADTITLRHTARSREGFARGALRAAQWIAGKQGMYEFREILK